MKIHEFYINRCLELAKNGLGNTYPNPSVGCVIVHKDKIIGEGYTSAAGGPHAEVNAINAVANKELLRSSTIYVTLEPCSHYGKTPPCANLIADMGIPKAVIGATDSNKAVSGKGIQKLEDSGCEVITGVLEEACRASNKRFFCFHEKKRPYIILKWAESQDGFIAPDPEQRSSLHPEPVWLSGKASRQLVHKWRSEEQAILVGTTTVLADNPSLTTRDWFGAHALRVFIDKHGKVPQKSHLLDGSTPTLVFTENEAHYNNSNTNQLEVCILNKELPYEQQLIKALYARNIQSMIIEGGATTLKGFIESGLWDEARIFKSPVSLDHGITAPDINGRKRVVSQIGSDTLTVITHSEE
ncbi:bifunctional diaminohydroxyphosphoribosylaminopyrimidine deaminase/5-amino-6-(5-phosphoribosylamino)uracil reductase RibD [Robertkochia sediminum]|uniref:bifunctional diaminohydroxyphosphoribosylaminopyrimidine deaminase/5-amino-6-(5-phosphoribosylamino)uracil reductase RibD n=1 Tax=Robertkochia sediminum TaxID=2785326 RepID=UPI001933E01D|nr:bifunctional diaminohydroxyphosphoribosylaminopyrimidine deaminase/5-amino-6-(5-phosphoribosylamino)uracil reductase RibD [Robertkochia sediminum]MBL7473686.1 bifunctional diaminohydroxyphosphoribosylaminopyrimidine deaminase/5-amino-6-(5-phosphoribosylamino)uracil reductase RibD [Robertkochia sediminum]